MSTSLLTEIVQRWLHVDDTDKESLHSVAIFAMHDMPYTVRL